MSPTVKLSWGWPRDLDLTRLHASVKNRKTGVIGGKLAQGEVDHGELACALTDAIRPTANQPA